MNYLKEKYYERKLSKKAIEEAYEKAQLEIDDGEFSKGLMAKAKSKSGNDIDKTEALYLDLRTEQILEENYQKIKQKNKRGGISLSNKSDKIALTIIGITLIVLIVLAIIAI